MCAKALRSAHPAGNLRSMADEWEHLDSRALESVGEAASEGVTLSRVIGLIDFIDRTVLNHHEAERTLRRLIGSGLVEEVRGLFRRTAEGEGVHTLCPSATPRERVRYIQAHLSATVQCTPSVQWSLARAAFESAVSEHHEEMRRAIDRES